MIRTSVTPQKTDLTISIPPHYVGKKIEILLYAVDEIATEAPKSRPQKLSELAGTLSSETAKSMQEYVTESRNEWENRLSNQL